MVGFIITIIISFVLSWIGNKLVHKRMPGGTGVTFLIALLGAWLGGYIPYFRKYGIVYDKVNITWAVLVSIIFVFLYGFFRKNIYEAKL